MPRRVAEYKRASEKDDNRRAAGKAFAASLKGEARRREPPSETFPLIDERKEPGREDGEPCESICPDCGGRQYWTESRGPGVACAEGHAYPAPSGIPTPECEPESRRSPAAEWEARAVPADPGSAFAESIGAPRPALSAGMGAIVERVFDVRPEETYVRLEKELRLGGRETKADRATVEAALEASQDNAREAHRLYAFARVELEAFELDARATLADMRAQATTALEQDRTAKKDAGARAKQITEADVEDWVASHFHDEHRAIQLQRKRAEKAVEHLERLAELWRSRPRTLEALFTAARV